MLFKRTNRCGTLKTDSGYSRPKGNSTQWPYWLPCVQLTYLQRFNRLWIWDCDRIEINTYWFLSTFGDQITNVFSKYTLCWGSTVRYWKMAYVRTELPFINARKVSRWSWECWVTQSLLLPQKHTDGQIHSFTLTRLYCNQACCLLAYPMQVTEDHWQSSVNSRLQWCVQTISSTAWFCKRRCQVSVMTLFSISWQEKMQLLHSWWCLGESWGDLLSICFPDVQKFMRQLRPEETKLKGADGLITINVCESSDWNHFTTEFQNGFWLNRLYQQHSLLNYAPWHLL